MHKQSMRGFPKNGATSNVATEMYLESGTNVVLPIPVTVTEFVIELVGGGGGSGAGAGGATGGDTTFTYNGTTYTAGGGVGAGGTGGALGGSATGGDLNIDGGRGDPVATDNAPRGGSPAMYGCGGPEVRDGVGYGAGSGGRADGGGNVGASGAGAFLRKKITVVPGQHNATYTVGAGGNSTYNGAPGLIIIRY